MANVENINKEVDFEEIIRNKPAKADCVAKNEDVPMINKFALLSEGLSNVEVEDVTPSLVEISNDIRQHREAVEMAGMIDEDNKAS